MFWLYVNDVFNGLGCVPAGTVSLDVDTIRSEAKVKENNA